MQNTTETELLQIQIQEKKATISNSLNSVNTHGTNDIVYEPTGIDLLTDLALLKRTAQARDSHVELLSTVTIPELNQELIVLEEKKEKLLLLDTAKNEPLGTELEQGVSQDLTSEPVTEPVVAQPKRVFKKPPRVARSNIPRQQIVPQGRPSVQETPKTKNYAKPENRLVFDASEGIVWKGTKGTPVLYSEQGQALRRIMQNPGRSMGFTELVDEESKKDIGAAIRLEQAFKRLQSDLSKNQYDSVVTINGTGFGLRISFDLPLSIVNDEKRD